MGSMDRDMVMSFLSARSASNDEYIPKSGELSAPQSRDFVCDLRDCELNLRDAETTIY